MTDPTILSSRAWDVIIIGTGVGGSTVGRSLALEGLSVLFLEKGTRVGPGQKLDDSDTPEARLVKGWWPHPISRREPDGNRTRFYAAIGCAQGGSSIHYAAALERMAAGDFDGLTTARGSMPAWPVSFDEFSPHYSAAEKLYGIAGATSDMPETRLSEWDHALMEQMRKNGLNPEPLKVAIRYDEPCQECIGVVCPRDCKADARVACLKEALQQPQCHILEHCDVQRLESDRVGVREVKAICRGRELSFRARVVVLSAGAMHTPQILLRSQNEWWPRGLANSSDQVGRNLMFHTSDLLALWAPHRLNRQSRQRKSISVRDFYLYKGRRLGYVQSMGMEAGRGEIAAHIKERLRRRGIRNRWLLSLLAKAPSHIGAAVFGSAVLFAAMTEDDPNPDNRIVLDSDEPNGASFSYTITENLRRRADDLRLAFSRGVRPWRMMRISADLDMNYGHPCGTCRFGDDRDSSVLDRTCRTHDLDNLYVVDASFMPRSGAINPSLTIAANALRVAPAIAAQASNLKVH